MKIFKLNYITIALLGALSLTSCEKALNINDNPNAPTTSTPALVLPQTFVATANSLVSFHNMGSNLVGYRANAGGYSGWGTLINYDFVNTNHASFWGTYDILNDIEYVITNTREDGSSQDYYYAALVMKAYNFALLVDTYNDVPYSQALLGAENLTPQYDNAGDIYVDLVRLLDESINYFKNNATSSRFASADIIFDGNEDNWAKFANTLKLRLVIKGTGKITFDNPTIDAAVGVLADDAIVNPGYVRQDGMQNPMWSSYAYNAAGANSGTNAYIPTPYIMSFYDGTKLSDEERATLTWRNGLTTNVNQLGNEDNPPTGYLPSAWVTSTNANSYRGYGVVKGPQAGQPILLGAEAQFLAAEAVVRGILSGNAQEYFDEGMKLAFAYLYKDESDQVIGTADIDASLKKYKDTNATSHLVHFENATTDEQKIEAIITQKYIAFNYLFGHEAWNEFRRTEYPRITGNNSAANARNTFVSQKSAATSPNRLPTRVLYPASEFNYNSANVPSVDKFSSKIFWAK